VLWIRLRDAFGVPLPKVSVWFDAYKSWTIANTNNSNYFVPENTKRDGTMKVSVWVQKKKSTHPGKAIGYPTFFTL